MVNSYLDKSDDSEEPSDKTDDDEDQVAETIKQQKKKGIMLDFDESLDDFKKRKFEEFKQRQQEKAQERMAKRAVQAADRSPR